MIQHDTKNKQENCIPSISKAGAVRLGEFVAYVLYNTVFNPHLRSEGHSHVWVFVFSFF